MEKTSNRSEAQKRADKKYKEKYDKEKMSQIGVSVRMPERAVYEKSAATYSMPLSQFMRKCAIYCIRNGVDITDVDLSIEDLQEEK